nr:preprotein translocase subunit SecG [Rothia aeria]
METLMTVLMVIIAITSVIAVLLVLLNRGQGGGLSDMFGGGMTSSLNSSGMASKNLIRLTVTVSIIWVVVIVLYGLALRFNGQIVF